MSFELDQESLKRWKDTFAKTGISYENDEDYKEAVYNLVGYFDMLIQMDQTQNSKSKTESHQD